MKQEITFKKLCLLVLGGIGFFWILQNYLLVLSIGGWVFGLLQPLFIGFCIAFVLNVPMRFLEGHLFTRTKKPILQALRRPLCILISIVFIVTVLSVIFLLVIPELLNAFGVLAKSIPLFLDAVLKGLQNWSAENADAIPSLQQWLANLKIDWAGIGRSLITFATTGAGNLLGSTVWEKKNSFVRYAPFCVPFSRSRQFGESKPFFPCRLEFLPALLQASAPKLVFSARCAGWE